MRIRNQSKARVAAGAGALIVAGVFFGSTAIAGAVGAAPVAGEPAPGTAPGETAPGETAPGDTAEAQQFMTQNGTMRITLPAGWSVTDDSRAAPDDEGELRWLNVVTFTAPDGSALFYYDGAGSDTGVPLHDWGVVDELAGQRGLAAVGWWQQSDHGITADVMLTDPAATLPGDPPAGVVTLDGVDRNHVLRMSADAGGAPMPQFATADDAAVWLQGAAPQQALAVISTVELLPVAG